MTKPNIEALWADVLVDSSEATAQAIQTSTHAAPLDYDAAPNATMATVRALVVTGTERTLGPDSVASPQASDAMEGAPAYRLGQELARGGMGIIYRATQSILQREVAVKTLNAAATANNAGHKFVAEALITARLDHPNIVPVYDLTTTADDRVALAMKLVRGTNWLELIKCRDDLEFHLNVLLDVANAIAFAHSRGVVHLDIKPENVLVGPFGEVIVVDWGLALDYRDDPSSDAVAPHKTALRSPCGTPAYLAPELAEVNVADIGPRTDVYLLGATLFEIATGRPPHLSSSPILALINAVKGETPRFEATDEVSDVLATIVLRACAHDPADRYPSVVAFQEALRGFIKHRQSVLICNQAGKTLDHARALAERLETGRALVYDAFADAVAGFRQAYLLWHGNGEAHDGEHRARLEYAEVALRRGDLSTAETQASLAAEGAENAPSSSPEATITAAHNVRAEIARRHEELAAEARSNARTRAALRLTTTLIVVVGLVAAWMIYREKQAAEASKDLAEARLSEVRRLADVKHVEELEAEAETLWPASPDRVSSMTEWLRDARSMVRRRDVHERALTALRTRSGREEAVDGRRLWTFNDAAERWQHDTQVTLIKGLQRLGQTLVPSVEKRLAFATTVRKRTVDDARAAWDEAIAAVAESPRYGGLKLAPQVGLVPLGADPTTGLWEFLHVQTGDPPERAQGTWRIADATGVVLVLLPGGRFRMGAARPTEANPAGAPNVDPRASKGEGPVHDVTLAPFLIGKYEITQAQFARIMGRNPAAYQPGKEVGGRLHSATHPIEQVRWVEADEAMRRMGLTLPTEAQWEYAARGETSTVYATGDDPLSLKGSLNIADAYCKANGGPGSWRYAEFIDDGYVVHAPVGSYRSNAFGLHDMAGNVWEWCADRFALYTAPVRAGDGRRQATDDSPRVFRGGGFRANTTHARTADRYLLSGKKYRAYDVGIRAARALEGVARP